MNTLFPALCLVALTAPLSAQHSQEPPSLAEFLPGNSLACIEMTDGVACLARIQAFTQPMPEGLPAPVRFLIGALPGLVRLQTGHDPKELMQILAAKDVCLGLLPGPARPFPVLLSRIEDPAATRRLMQRIRRLAFRIDGKLLTVSDSAEHLRAALQVRKQGGKIASLLRSAKYLKHRRPAPAGRGLTIYVDVAALRRTARLGNGEAVFAKLDAAGRLLVGGWLQALGGAEVLQANLQFSKDSVELAATVDGVPGPALRRLMREGATPRPTPPDPPGMLARVSLDRSLAEFLESADSLLKDEDVAQVKTFLSMADLFVRGTTFIKGVAKAMEQPPTLFVAESAAENPDNPPGFRLPAFALVVPILEKQHRRFVVTVKNAMRLISSIAIADRRREKKQPDLRLRSERRDGLRFDFLEFDDWPGPGAPPTEVGIAVTLLFAHGHGILATTRDGAVRVAKALATEPSALVRGDQVVLRGQALARFATANLGPLVLDRVLDEGETLVEARRFYDVVCAASRCLDFRSDLYCEGAQTRLSMSLKRLR